MINNQKAKANPLASNELGEKGESRFLELCADAKLICNKSTRDLSGWDFIVEFPLKGDGGRFDHRIGALSCHVQTKTLNEHRNSFKIRLSAAERLAKELKPTFICVLKVDESLGFCDLYLIHLWNGRLGEILKRLRLEESKGTLASELNQKYISLTLKESERIQFSGASLRDAIEHKCSEGMHEYALAKQQQLEKLGYDSNAPIAGKMSLHAKNLNDLDDIFLGFKKAQVLDLEVFSQRFGIKMPEISGSSGEITITPHPADTCRATFRFDGSEPPVVRTGEMFVPALPLAPGRIPKVYFKLDGLTVIYEDGSLEVSLENEEDRYCPQEWRDAWRMRQAFSSGVGTFELSSSKGLEISCPMVTIQPERLGECINWCKYCERVSYVLRIAGVAKEPKVTLEELQQVHQKVCGAYGLLTGGVFEATFELLNTVDVLQEQPRALLHGSVLIGGIPLAYYGVMHLELIDSTVKRSYKTTRYEHRRIQILGDLENKYDEFVSGARLREGIEGVLNMDNFSFGI